MKAKQNEKGFIISIIAVNVVLVIMVIGFGIQNHRLGQYRYQSEYYRTELARADSRKQLFADEIDECFNSVARTNRILSGTAATVSELREQLQEVRKEYENLEDHLLCFYDSLHSDDSE